MGPAGRLGKDGSARFTQLPLPRWRLLCLARAMRSPLALSIASDYFAWTPGVFRMVRLGGTWQFLADGNTVNEVDACLPAAAAAGMQGNRPATLAVSRTSARASRPGCSCFKAFVSPFAACHRSVGQMSCCAA